MPWQLKWPPYVSQRVLDDRRRAADDLDQSSGDLKETIEHARRVTRVATALQDTRSRNHFSESMEILFATRARSAPAHHPKDTR